MWPGENQPYVYFSVYSETATADKIASYLGLSPDRTRVRGSRSPDPPRPRHHSWQLMCDSRGLPIDEQVANVLDRIRKIQDRLVTIGELLGKDGGCCLQLVRYFNDEEGEEEDLSPPGAPLQKLSGQHQLLGWHLERDAITLLARVGAEIDADEYG